MYITAYGIRKDMKECSRIRSKQTKENEVNENNDGNVQCN